MATMEEIVKSIDIRYLEDGRICYRCVAVGINFADSLHHPGDMIDSPSTKDSVCQHCYDTEEEFGHERMGKPEKTELWELIDEFNRVKELRLRREYDGSLI
jgi:hypothetical protein